MNKSQLNTLTLNIPVPSRYVDKNSALATQHQQGISYSLDQQYASFSAGIEYTGFSCGKFKKQEIKNIGIRTQDVASYIYLREKKIPKMDALNFAASPKCKVDVTNKSIGPSRGRHMIPLIFDKFQCSHGTIDGPLMRYDISGYPEYFHKIRDDVDQEDFEKFCKIYRKEIYNDSTKKNQVDAEKKREEDGIQQQYLAELNREYRLRGLKKPELTKKINSFHQKLTSYKKNYFELDGNVKIYNFGDEARQPESNIAKNVLKNFNAFKDPIMDLRKQKELLLREYAAKVESVDYLQYLKNRQFKKPRKSKSLQERDLQYKTLLEEQKRLKNQNEIQYSDSEISQCENKMSIVEKFRHSFSELSEASVDPDQLPAIDKKDKVSRLKESLGKDLVLSQKNFDKVINYQ